MWRSLFESLDYLLLTKFPLSQRTISDLEGKIYKANYSQKYLTENVQDLQTKLENERCHIDILKERVELNCKMLSYAIQCRLQWVTLKKNKCFPLKWCFVARKVHICGKYSNFMWKYRVKMHSFREGQIRRRLFTFTT